MDTAIEIIRIFLWVLSTAIFLMVISSWFIMFFPRSRPLLTIHNVLRLITDPILAPLRRIIPTIGMVDITPVVAIILLYIINVVLLSVFS